MKYSSIEFRDIPSIIISSMVLSILPILVIVFVLDFNENSNSKPKHTATLPEKPERLIVHPEKDTILHPPKAVAEEEVADSALRIKDAKIKLKNSEINALAIFLAGIPQEHKNRIKKYERSAAWTEYSQKVKKKWQRLHAGQMQKITGFSDKELAGAREFTKVLFYPFSGPDFLHAYSFFPDAETYILVGLEKVGTVPDLGDFATDTSAYGYIAMINRSLRDVLNLSFFITKSMKTDFRNREFDGVMPVLLIFMARTGNGIVSIRPVDIDRKGFIKESRGYFTGEKNTRGVEMEFLDPHYNRKKLYYFSVNLANDNLSRDSALIKLINRQENITTYLKAASYLMHRESFSIIRDLILRKSGYLLQDDSGIPVHFFRNSSWQLRFYGTYNGPIALFSDKYQEDLYEYYQNAKNIKPLDFGIGYKFRRGSSNLMLAEKR